MPQRQQNPQQQQNNNRRQQQSGIFNKMRNTQQQVKQ